MIDLEVLSFLASSVGGFVLRDGRWDVTLDLEASDMATKSSQEHVAQTASVAMKERGISVVTQTKRNDG